jgi:phage baseplate assembly protein W
MTTDTSFLGRGWSFPPSFQRGAGVQMLDGEDDIRSSLEILLSTRIGERVMQPEYGCNTDRMVFESMTTGFQTSMKNQVEKAILSDEPRIDLNNIDLVVQDPSAGRVLIIVDYTVRTTNTRGNLVYPFYLTEGNI